MLSIGKLSAGQAAGDPQLHTHVLVANLGRGPDGRWSALDGRRLYAHARAASFVYQAVLRAELTRTLGLEWLPVRNGIAELVGVPKPVLRAFSRRRAEIEAAMAARGATGPRAAEAAALATRQTKRGDLTLDDLVADWRVRAAELGLDHGKLERLLGRVHLAPLDNATWQRIFAELASPAGLTQRASTFSRRDVFQALCEHVPAGALLDARTIETATNHFLASPHAVALLPAHGEGEVYRRSDGRLLPIERDELAYSTPELLALEQRVIRRVSAAHNCGTGVAHEQAVRAVVASRPTLSAEQRGMVEHLCLHGDGVSVVVGKAGTGKTFALAAAREAWQDAGLPVLGVAVARRAARELERDAGIRSTSVAALLGYLRDRAPGALPERCVLVVDEAGMVPTRQLAQLIDAAAAVVGKLVLVGDHRQLPELEAGGAFRGFVNRGLAIELTENHRQVNPWERAALDDLREGRGEQALAHYLEREGFQVATASDGERAVALARELDPDVIVLDLMLPGIDGIEACRQIRTFSDAYVVMLTARVEEVDRIVGLSTGADDYVTKPFSPGELMARVRAMLRRPRASRAQSDAPRRVGDLEIDPTAREVRHAGQPLQLTKLEFDLLDVLSAEPRVAFTREQLLERVWGGAWFGDDHVVDVHVANLRAKLGDDPRAPRYVRTIRGVGYRMGDG